MSPDGQTLASSGGNSAQKGDRTVKLWDTETGELKRTLEPTSDVVSLAFAPEGNRLASGGGGAIGGQVMVWNLATGESHGLRFPTTILSVAFSPDGKLLATGDQEAIGFYEPSGNNEQPLRRIKSPARVDSVAFSPDGKWVASGTADNIIRIYKVATGELRSTLAGHSLDVITVAFSPDGMLLASGSKDYTARIWSARTGALLQTLRTSHKDFVHAVRFSPDGKTLATANGEHDPTVRLWDTETGVSQRVLSGHLRAVSSVAFSADGQRLFTGSKDATVRFWDPQRGRLLATVFSVPAADAAEEPFGATKSLEFRSKLVPTTRGEGANNYLVLTPEGYYGGSAAADRFVNFNLGAELYPAECFQACYYRPDLVRRALSGDELPGLSELKGPFPPRVRFATINDATAATVSSVEGGTVTLNLEATDDSAVTRLALFVNGTRVSAKPIEIRSKQIPQPAAAGPRAHERVVSTFATTVPLPPNETVIRLKAIAYDDDGLQSRPAEIILRHTRAAAIPSKLLGLCVGVSRYVDNRLNLHCAANDATALAEVLKSQKRTADNSALYADAKITVLTDLQATRDRVEQALESLAAQVTRNDTVVIFLSGHGCQSEDGGFYFATSEVNRFDLAHTALSWDEVVRNLARLSERAGRVLLMLDACHSGRSTTNEDLVKAGANTGVIIFASSKGSEVSIEGDMHGFFTQALLEAFAGQGLSAGETQVTIIDVIYYVGHRVRELSRNTQHPHVPHLNDFNTDVPIAVKPQGQK